MVCSTVASYAGWAFLSYLLFVIGRFVYSHFIDNNAAVAQSLAKRGWAVVTGASDGIGKAYALELARLKFKVLLVSRTAEKLEAVANEIRSTYSGSEVRVYAFNFQTASPADYDRLRQEIQSLPGSVSLLVNNVGINYDYPERFGAATERFGPNIDEEIVKVNITATNNMTRIVLPNMEANKAGGIIFLSSFSGRVPTPLLAVYSGTKAYMDYFSKALWGEYSRKGIFTQSVTPGMVVSNMSKIRRTSLTVAAPGFIARRSLVRLGKDIEISPYWSHSLMIAVLNLLPLGMSLGQVASTNDAVRGRAIKKQGSA